MYWYIELSLNYTKGRGEGISDLMYTNFIKVKSLVTGILYGSKCLQSFVNDHYLWPNTYIYCGVITPDSFVFMYSLILLFGSRIGGLTISTVQSNFTAGGRAFQVEQCHCGSGYSGSSCEVFHPFSLFCNLKEGNLWRRILAIRFKVIEIRSDWWTAFCFVYSAVHLAINDKECQHIHIWEHAYHVNAMAILINVILTLENAL